MKFVKYFLILSVCCIFLGVGSIYGLYRYIEPRLPDVATLKDIRLQTPMLVYSADGELMAQFGEKRRIPLALSQMPKALIDAFIATEDSRFYEHHGVDAIAILRAASIAVSSGHASQGASTITQQLARNFFLSSERTFDRKIKEAFLAIRIEQLLSKKEILELYLNRIYLGYRAYGVGAAAQVYFNKTVDQLTLGEMAMIAGLPKAPSTFNPLYSHERALARRNVVLSRMLSENYITKAQYDAAIREPLVASYHAPNVAFEAPYVTEMVRQEMVKRYGENAYTDGYKVYTTVRRPLQQAAQEAVRDNILNYDMRHGYRGPAKVLWKKSSKAWSAEKIQQALNALPEVPPLEPAVVTAADDRQATAVLKNGKTITLTLTSVHWARPFKNDLLQGVLPRRVSDVVKAGEQIWVRARDDQWQLAQLPQVNSALVSLDPDTGAILALVGGFNYQLSKFNRATQAVRQLGSNIKPFLYTAAMDKGFTLASIINDAPVSRWDPGTGTEWRPKNSPPVYDGPISLRRGLGQSKNVVMVRAMRAMGVDYAAQYLERFGFPAHNIVRTESLALGSASFTPLQVARGYAVIANGGYLVEPWFISKIEDVDGKAVYEAKPKTACHNCDLPVIYGDTPKVTPLTTDNIENLVQNQSPGQDVPQPELETITASETQPDADAASQPAAAQPDPRVSYAPHVISTPLTFLMKSALNTNIFGEPGWNGTGWRAARDLKRHDIGGKTGTTNSSKDAWFSGYGPGVVTTVWIGFDDHRRSLGKTTPSGVLKDQITGYEGGAKSAQPAWDAYMQKALADIPEQPLTPPPGIVSVVINKSTGKLSRGGPGSRSEYFIAGTEPKEYYVRDTGTTVTDDSGKNYELF